jgi:uncharacterized membrane protein YhdT
MLSLSLSLFLSLSRSLSLSLSLSCFCQDSKNPTTLAESNDFPIHNDMNAYTTPLLKIVLVVVVVSLIAVDPAAAAASGFRHDHVCQQH